MSTENKIYGYARVSTAKQKIQRQIDNIEAAYPDAIIIQDVYTGTSMERPNWIKLEKKLRSGDTVVFDEVSRMSRDAEEGFEVYKELYDRGVNLKFLKESTLDTEHFRKTQQLAMTGQDIDCILEGINKYLMILAENQIKAAFETAEHEVQMLRKRTSDSVQKAIVQGKPVGRPEGKTAALNKNGEMSKSFKKAEETKKAIKERSKAFGGDLNLKDCLTILGISRGTYFKYRKEILEEMERENG